MYSVKLKFTRTCLGHVLWKSAWYAHTCSTLNYDAFAWNVRLRAINMLTIVSNFFWSFLKVLIFQCKEHLPLTPAYICTENYLRREMIIPSDHVLVKIDAWKTHLTRSTIRNNILNSMLEAFNICHDFISGDPCMKYTCISRDIFTLRFPIGLIPKSILREEWITMIPQCNIRPGFTRLILLSRAQLHKAISALRLSLLSYLKLD